MNRPIKFRAWHSNLKQMVDGNDIRLDFHSLNGGFKHEVYKFMQFTGSLDKNGKEIFEGDIVDWKFSPYYPEEKGRGVISWVEGAFHVGKIGSGEQYCPPNDFTSYLVKDVEEIEIIGNYFENPDLIKN